MNIMKHMVHDERDILLTGEKREGSRTMEEKVQGLPTLHWV